MLGMCFGGFLFGQLARFGYERLSGKDEGSNLFLVVAPAAAGLGIGMSLVGYELSSIGAADWIFWLVSVPSILLMLWAIPTCFLVFVLIPALGGLGVLLNLSQSASAKATAILNNSENGPFKLIHRLVLPFLLIRDLFRPSHPTSNHRPTAEKNTSRRSAYVWIALILIAVFGFKILGSKVNDVRQQIKAVKEKSLGAGVN